MPMTNRQPINRPVCVCVHMGCVCANASCSQMHEQHGQQVTAQSHSSDSQLITLNTDVGREEADQVTAGETGGTKQMGMKKAYLGSVCTG